MNGAPNVTEPAGPGERRYRWPWVVLAAFVLAVLLAVAWMAKEIQRTKRLRDLNNPAAVQAALTSRTCPSFPLACG